MMSTVVPVHLIDDKLQEMSQEDLNALSNKDRAELASNMRYMDKKLERLGLHLGDLEDDARDRVQILNRRYRQAGRLTASRTDSSEIQTCGRSGRLSQTLCRRHYQ